MQEGTKVMKGKPILEWAEEYIKKLNGVTEALGAYKDLAIQSQQVTEMLNEAMRTQLVVMEKVMHREDEPEAPHVQGKESVLKSPKEKIDELIVTLAGNITGILTNDRMINYQGTVPEKTRALAELITARSRMEEW